MPQLVTWLDVEMMARVLLAFVLGGVIGYEREMLGRPAGLRTHMLVAAGAACFTLASVYAFAGQGTQRDPARVAANIVTGIGFLGAGTVWRTPSAVRGLTTAASIWLTAAIGMLAGAGMYPLAIFTTALGYVTLLWLRPAGRRKQRVGEPSMVPEQGAEEEGEEDLG